MTAEATRDKYGYVDPDAAKKYGYGDDADEGLGYGDAAPDSAAKYGYGDAAADDDDYGYGDAAPDSAASAHYTAPDDSAKYGYGDDDKAADENNNAAGYGEYHTGYNDGSGGGGAKTLRRNRTHSDDGVSVDSEHSAATAESYGEYAADGQPRRQRYRRRGSVTKYSLSGADEVKHEYDAHSNVINQYRGTTDGDAAMQPAMEGEAASGDELGVGHPHHEKKNKGKKILKGLKQFSKRRFSVSYP